MTANYYSDPLAPVSDVPNTPGGLPREVQVQQTRLQSSQEAAYQQWKATLPPRLQYEGNYDLRGFWQKNPNFSVDKPGQHMTDEFKLPNHPTFSDESKYFGPETRHLAGHWNGDVYTPYDPRFKDTVDETPVPTPAELIARKRRKSAQ